MKKFDPFHPGFLEFLASPVFIIRHSLRKSIVRHAPGITGHVLDFGCGSKPYRKLFSEAESYTGCDIATSGHDHADSHVDVFYDGERLPFEDASFDAVVSFEVFEHVFNLHDVLKEIARVVKPGGKLLISCPFAWDEHEKPYDYARYTSFGLPSLLSSGGFDVVLVEKTNTYVLAVAQMWVAYLAQHVMPRGKYLSRVFRAVVIFPTVALAYALNAVLPKNYDYFSNLVILATRR